MRQGIKNFIFRISFWAAAIILLLSSFLIGGRVRANAEELTPDNNYWFESIRTEIKVNRDKTYSVTERMTVGFRKGGINTGIIRDIQRASLTTRVIDGKEKKGRTYLANVGSVAVTVDGAAARVTQSYYDAGRFFSVKMQKQDASYFNATDEESGTGFHEFVLSYIYDASDDKLSGFDDFTFDVLGYAMAETIVFSAVVEFPVNTDLSSVSARTNEKAAWIPAEGEGLTVVDNKVTMTACPNRRNMGYTLQVILPDRYFERTLTHFWYYWMFAVPAVAAIAIGLVAALKYLPRKTVAPVEVAPPDNMSIMRVSALWHGESRVSDAPAVILQWAAKGYVELQQDGKRHIFVRKKISELPITESREENDYFNALFTGEDGTACDVFSTKQLRRSRTLGAETKKRKLGRAAEAMSIAGDSPDPVYKGRGIALCILFFSSLAPVLLMSIYDMILAKNALALFFFIFLAASTAINYPNKIGAFYFVPVIFLFVFPVPSLGQLLFASFRLYDYAFLYVVSVIWWAVAYLLHFFMLRRTPQANHDLGRLKGFRRFVLTAELPRIKLLFDENPDWFSSVLPYCFVMGISKKVEKRFCALGIAAPEWMNGGSVSSIGRSVSHGMRSCGGGGGRSGGGGGHGGSSGGGGGGGGSRGC